LTPFISFKQVTKRFHALTVVDQLDLDIARGEFVSLLGPSGSGKTTLLMMLAGFEQPTSGTIHVDGHRVDELPPYKREMGVVFQSYALFPHMSVRDNIAFPLKMRGTQKAEIAERVARALDMVKLGAMADRKPAQLSGGQQQRVALARALVFEPQVILMDEPLGALDKKLREQMQIEIKHIHRSVGTTVVYVTHDQEEALTMSDIVVVMHQSRIAQVGSPRALYESPANLFVADFLGDSNLLPGRIVETAGGQAIVELGNRQVVRVARGEVSAMAGQKTVVLVRPEDMRVGEPVDGQDAVSGRIIEVSYHGDSYRLEIAVGTDRLKVKVPRFSGTGLEPGQDVQIAWRPDAARLVPIDDAAAGGAGPGGG
jgi:putative spermidine/putrescine transport system ATP-binding protein